ncbi:hypothetical protein DFH06DRAFT_1395540 [Mycena polygramma]|nr:hypothetical protein DFH06DRAFT_1395540 [Mycena polygramma]
MATRGCVEDPRVTRPVDGHGFRGYGYGLVQTYPRVYPCPTLFDYAAVTVEEGAASPVPSQAGASSADAGDTPPRAQRVRGNYVVQPTPDTEPSFVTRSTGPVRRTEKTLDATESTTSAAPTSPSTERSTIAPTTTTTTTASTSPSGRDQTSPSSREQFLEARLAQLEAHVQQHLPPPYQAPPEG